MSRCGNCALYGSDGTGTYGITCPGNRCVEDCAETLQDFVAELQEVPGDNGKDKMDAEPTIYALLAVEDSVDYGASTHLRFFRSKEKAQAAMKKTFENNKAILNWPDEDDPEEQFCAIFTETSIRVKDGEDHYSWEIFEGEPEDLEESSNS